MSSDRRTYHLWGRHFDYFKNLSWQSYFNCIYEPHVIFSDYYNLRRKSYASESGKISNSEQPHMWFINIACACTDDINEEFLNWKIIYLLCGLQILAVGFQDLEENRPSCGHASKGPMDRWSVKSLVAVCVEDVVGRISVAHVTPNRAILCVSLGVGGLPGVSKGAVGPEGVRSHASARLCGRSAPTHSLLWPHVSLPLLCLGYCCSLSLRTGETGSSGKCLNFSVWNGCHRCRFLCVRRGWLSLSVRRVGERRVSGDLPNPWEWAEVCQPSWLPPHAHPRKTILPLRPVWPHTHTARWLLLRCFHAKKFPLICGNVSGRMEVCLAFFFFFLAVFLNIWLVCTL